MQPCDEPQAATLWKGLSPYRPGNKAEVEAMGHSRKGSGEQEVEED